ncbi:MAG: heme-binding protein [Burkholderiaceae bacterium]
MNTVHRSASTAFAAALSIAGAMPSLVAAQDATFGSKSMTPEVALRAAQAALSACRDAGYQVTVAVVDRGGLLQVLLRDRFAGAHTVSFARDKAWTAASFRISTEQLRDATGPDKPEAGIRQLAGVAAVAGGLPIDAGGAHVGAIGVSGAPGGQADEQCARAGIEAVADDLAF